MKKAMKQSTLTLILNGISILALLYLMYSLISYSDVSKQLNVANEERFELTYQANRFMNGSAYLTNEVRAFAATGEQEHYDNYWNEVNVLKNRDQGVAALQEIGITDEEQGMIDDMYALSNQLVPLEDEAMKEVQAGEKEKAIEYVYGTENLRSFGKEELCEDEAKRFLHLWTLKGSYVKMTGEGMRVPFDTVCFDMGGFRETEHGILQSEKAGQHKSCLFVQKDTAMALALKDDSADKGTDVIWLPYSSAGF